jgi:hypothetical protein
MISSLERYMTQQDDNQRLGMPADESVGDRAEVDRATTKKLLTPDELDSDDAAYHLQLVYSAQVRLGWKRRSRDRARIREGLIELHST